MKILVIAAHPDDEILGCGGTLHKLSRTKENKIFIAFATDGVGGRGKNNESADFRKKESFKAAKFLNTKILNQENEKYYPFYDQKIDSYDFNEVVSWVKRQIEKVKPDNIYTHYVSDMNRDHSILAEAVFVATRPNKYSNLKKIYSFEINMGCTNQGQALGNAIFNPNVFEKIDINRKIKLFDYYQSEHKYWKNWETDIGAVARFRGMSAGYDFAEAFILVRQRND